MYREPPLCCQEFVQKARAEQAAKQGPQSLQDAKAAKAEAKREKEKDKEKSKERDKASPKNSGCSWHYLPQHDMLEGIPSSCLSIVTSQRGGTSTENKISGKSPSHVVSGRCALPLPAKVLPSTCTRCAKAKAKASYFDDAGDEKYRCLRALVPSCA